MHCQILSLSQRRMLGMKCMFQMFEYILWTLLTTREFHVEKRMDTVSFVGVETSDKE